MTAPSEKTAGAPGAAFDIVIIGAGISGINAAYRMQTQVPHLSYTILEGRDAMGGTWDYFKYPALRSDSDLHTFGFPFRPWESSNPIADGPSIRKYINDTAAEYGIDKHIQYNQKVTSASWSSKTSTWTLEVLSNGKKRQVEARFVFSCCGYYSYDEALPVNIPGLENFKGQIVHPQFWPEDLDYANKRVAIIGSGATAITLLPELAKTASHVTMVQRSPGYIVALPTRDPVDRLAKAILPRSLAFKFLRLKYIARIYFSFYLFRAFPSFARWVLRRMTVRQLPKDVPHDPHFVPTYNPWDQRLCLCPDGDFFKALHRDNVSIVTDHIAEVTPKGIRTKKGDFVDADIIVTATGLKIMLNGGIRTVVDGEVHRPQDSYVWKGQLVSDVPNWSLSMGYTNASWTLGSDTKAQFFCRLVSHMDAKGYKRVVPRVGDDSQMRRVPLLGLNSTYVRAAEKNMPKAAAQGPWQMSKFYPQDLWRARRGGFECLEFS